MKKKNVKEGRFYFREDVLWIDVSFDGKRYRRSTGKIRSKEVETWIKNASPRDFFIKMKSCEIEKKCEYDLISFGASVLSVSEDQRGHETQKDYLSIVRNIIAPFFDNKVRAINLMTVSRCLLDTREKYSPDRWKRIKSVLSKIVSYAAEHELIEKNYMTFASIQDIKAKKSEVQTQAYNVHEIKKISTASRGWLKIFLELSFRQGLRVGEAMGLQWADFDLKRGKLFLRRSITKGVVNDEKNSIKNHYRTIKLMPTVVKLLESYYLIRPDDIWLFINKDGHPFKESKTIVHYHFKPLLESIHVEYKTLAATRRSYTSVMKYGSMPMEKIQKLLGHSKGSRVTNAHYVKEDVIAAGTEALLADHDENIYDAIMDGKLPLIIDFEDDDEYFDEE